MTDRETLGERMLLLRRRARLTLRQLAAKVSREPSTLIAIEQDRTDPRLSTIRAIAKALEVTVGELVDGTAETDGD
jgi:XRE family transcriptional regulator, fatty acid utilization regulator